MNLKQIDSVLCGALHRTTHPLDRFSVLVYGALTSHETALVAIAGSLGLIVAGVALILLSAHPAARMIGIVFLCRAWIDALPVCDLDSAMMAEGTGWIIAWLVAIAEILICGGMIWYALNDRHVYSGTQSQSELLED
jgi:hypothetical protein